ncbi:exodeoxyribonuclease-3 [Desulfobotulus alkaliphilus]|uniref:Exodeoxyribonuclease-3 n=1 Tax=Desulfobotulus alkaliphilus TaxID=622671 RepID=A0A562RX73_9BACT|nr:exodeoxyribonuclease III [Desulfobotulus alkaliphilus]TWI73204.1 exodeoxyribonuclease-3 [Desulfobotulus alkaliphilus]
MTDTFRIVSWNVNGLRAIWKKDFEASVKALDADILMLQETKLQEDQRSEEMLHLAGYPFQAWSYARSKKGYSGVMSYSRTAPASTSSDIGVQEFDDEGRVNQLDFEDFTLFNVYFPNGQMSEERLDYKLRFYEAFFSHADGLRRKGRPVIVCGDYNTAHNDIDLKHPKANADRSGFLRIERDWLDRLMAGGWTDTFRHLYPDTVKYSWWSYRSNARKTNAGWRIDLCLVSQNIVEKGWLKSAFIDNDIMGSDHCPVGLTLEIP